MSDEAREYTRDEMREACRNNYNAGLAKPNPWRETVRDLYDEMHFGPDNIFTGNRLAQRVVDFIEERHPDYFTAASANANNNRT